MVIYPCFISSLCNLAVTSVFLRELCCSLLDRKGCVTLQWERIRKDNRYHWQISHKVCNRKTHDIWWDK